MAYQVELEFSSRTDTGLIRAHNEDSIVHSEDYGLAVLADGMGGYNAGEVASGIATNIFHEALIEAIETKGWNPRGKRSKLVQSTLLEAVEAANEAILEAARIDPNCTGMGTTIVAALFYQDRLTIVHVGDSRAYRYRDGALEPITRDHSLLQEQIDAGLIDEDMARFATNKNLITRAVGVDQAVEPEIHDHQTLPGDIYLLCSDGLSDMLITEEIQDVLNRSDLTLDEKSDLLISKANHNGGKDNSSVILVRVHANQSAPKEGVLGRFKSWVS